MGIRIMGLRRLGSIVPASEEASTQLTSENLDDILKQLKIGNTYLGKMFSDPITEDDIEEIQ